MLHLDKWLQIWILICLLKGYHANESIKRTLKLVKGPNGCQGKVPKDGFLEEVSVNSKIECAKTCFANENCASVYYLSNSQTCKIHGQEITEIPGDQLTPKSGVMYYVPDKFDQSSGIFTTPTLAPLTEDAPCPNETSIFLPAQTSDGTNFQFRIFLDIPRKFDEAHDLCECHGAKLYKLLTPEKMAFALNLMACQANVSSTNSYWANAKSDTNGWWTTDGDPMPINSTVWAAGRPEDKSPPRCARLSPDFEYKLDDTPCETSSSIYAFCEK